jgi:hypothetical protein
VARSDQADDTLPRVGKGTQKDEDWVLKVEPGA